MFAFSRKQSSQCTNCWREKAMIYCSVIICYSPLPTKLFFMLLCLQSYLPYSAKKIFVILPSSLYIYLLCSSYKSICYTLLPTKLFATLLCLQNYLLHSRPNKMICYTLLLAKLFAKLLFLQSYLLYHSPPCKEDHYSQF